MRVDFHRFRDFVALSLTGHDSRGVLLRTPTFYVQAAEARAIAAQLLRFADDVDAGPFGESDIRSAIVRVAPPAHVYDKRED